MPIVRVCSSCFHDPDIRKWIRHINGPRGCDACKKHDSPTCRLDALCDHIESCLRKYWGMANDQLPYDSAEGGFLGETWDTYDILRDEIGLELPRDRADRLFQALVSGLTDQTWCDFDWGELDHDVALKTSWKEFCHTVKHKRRFFFHSSGADDRDSYSAASLLNTIAVICQNIKLIKEIPIGKKLWRARIDLAREKRKIATEFGPPPADFSLQNNRMNPPGISMLYLSSTSKTALREIRKDVAYAGQWVVYRPLRVLDLRKLPDVPGVFSKVSRTSRLALRFLHHFADDIMLPVTRDDRVNVDYLPSQVITEFFRDFEFEGGTIDGVAYGSTVHKSGWNVALFAEPEHLGLQQSKFGKKYDQWLSFSHSTRCAI